MNETRKMKTIWMLAAVFALGGAQAFGKPSGAEKADFVVTSMGVDPAAPVRGQTFSLAVTVRNQGSVAGDAGVLRVWASKPGVAKVGEAGDAQQAVGSLAAGETRTFAFALAVPTRPGMHHARAFVDADGMTSESNAGNNQEKTKYKPQSGGPAILPAQVELSGLEQTYDGQGKPVVVATDPAGLAVEVTYDDAAAAPVGAGSYAVVATVVEEGYEGSATGTLVVAKAVASVTLDNLVQTYDGAPKAVEVSTDPDALPVEVIYGAGSDSSLAGRAMRVASLLPVAAGTYAVEAIAADENHAGRAAGTLAILPASQTIDFPEFGDQWTTAVVDLSATASSGLPVAFSVVAGPASIDGTTLAFTGAGTVSILASQAGDDNWSAAPDVIRTVQVQEEPPALVVSASGIHVREDGEGRFFVRLSKAPNATVTVAVSRGDGSADLTVQSGSTLAFKPSNWNGWQPVTLRAAPDENDVGETATFLVSSPGMATLSVVATALDSHVGLNLALASAGATVAGKRGYRLEDAFDGIHDVSTNYAFTTWGSVPPGSITVDLQAAALVSRVRLSTWDWTYREHQYVIESSTDGASWAVVADASAGAHHGWEEWPVADEPIRYLRFTGLTNTANSAVCLSELEVYGTARPQVQEIGMDLLATNVNVREAGEGRLFIRLARAPTENVVVSVARMAGDENLSIQGEATLTFKPSDWNWYRAVTLVAAADDNAVDETAQFRISIPGMPDQVVTVTALDDDIGENLALASGGTTIAGQMAGQLSQAIDGVHAVSTNYAYTVWTNLQPGSMTVDLQAAMTVSRVRLLTWDWNYRDHRYLIEASEDGVNWSLLADASAGAHRGWEDWPAADAAIRYLRFTGLENSVNAGVCVPEIEVYGTRPTAPGGLVAVQSAAPASSPAPVAVPLESEPVLVLTSDGPEDETGWNAVDGDDATAWVGQKAGGGYLVVEYRPTLTLSGLEVDVAETSLADAQVLTSLDGQEWQPLPDDLEANPVVLNFLWIVFPDDGTAAVPEVLAIRPNP